MEYQPPEILEIIFKQFLSLKDLIKCFETCLKWRKFIGETFKDQRKKWICKYILKLKFLLKFQFSGKILIAGGIDHENEEVETIEVIDLIDMKFQHMLENSMTGKILIGGEEVGIINTSSSSSSSSSSGSSGSSGSFGSYGFSGSTCSSSSTSSSSCSTSTYEQIGFVLQDNIFLGESDPTKRCKRYLKNFVRVKHSENEPVAKRTKHSETTNEIECTQKILNSKLKNIPSYCLVLNNDEILVVGNQKSQRFETKTILQLIKLGKEPEKIGELPFSITNFSMIKVNEDKVYIVGGILSLTDIKKTWIIDIYDNYKLIEGPVLNKTIKSPSLALMKIVNKT